MSGAVDTGTNQLLRTVADHVATGVVITGAAAPMAAAEPPA